MDTKLDTKSLNPPTKFSLSDEPAFSCPSPQKCRRIPTQWRHHASQGNLSSPSLIQRFQMNAYSELTKAEMHLSDAVVEGAALDFHLPDHVLQLLLLVHMERGSNSLTVSSRHRLRLHLAEPCTLCIAAMCASRECSAFILENMEYQHWTIKEAMHRIGAKKLYLPAIQRKFVWGAPQIEQLFDSIMRDYPIGTRS